jgi:hypothetical protein
MVVLLLLLLLLLLSVMVVLLLLLCSLKRSDACLQRLHGTRLLSFS